MYLQGKQRFFISDIETLTSYQPVRDLIIQFINLIEHQFFYDFHWLQCAHLPTTPEPI